MRLAEAIAEGRQAAFHGRPADGTAVLRQALARSAAAPTAECEEASWLLGVCLAAGGFFGSALETVAPLWRTAAEQTANAHCLASSVYRQIGLFATAAEHDQAALEDATGAVRCEALLGLAADAVGVGQPDIAAGHLAAAHELWRPAWWREGIRLAWVDAEVALLLGEPARALPRLRAALSTAHDHRAPRHAAKTKLFLAVAMHTAAGGAGVAAESRREAQQLLTEAAVAAQRWGTLPLVWATYSVQQEWLQEAGEVSRALQAGQIAADAASIIASDLPAHLRTLWLARPDVHVPAS